jgi:hypothetical protein
MLVVAESYGVSVNIILHPGLLLGRFFPSTVIFVEKEVEEEREKRHTQ